MSDVMDRLRALVAEMEERGTITTTYANAASLVRRAMGEER